MASTVCSYEYIESEPVCQTGRILLDLEGSLLDLGPSSGASLLMARLEQTALMKWDHYHFLFIPLFSLSLFVTFLLAYANQNLIFVETKS